MAFIFTKQAAEILGRKSIGRDDLTYLGIKFEDGPVTQGGNKLILVDEDSCRGAAAARAERKSNNKKVLEQHRFVSTVKTMEVLMSLKTEVAELKSLLLQLLHEPPAPNRSS